MLTLLLAVVLTGCGPTYVFEEEQRLDETTGWAYNTPLAYDFTVADTNTLYTLHLILEHTTTFNSQNAYVLIRTIFPDGERLEEQVSLQLADKFGQWFGDCSQEVCTLDIPIQQNAFFQRTGEYRIEIEQFTRDNPLRGFKAITFAMEETGKK
ncbi:MAG: gliding motility lipoprotein GldH [Bacteroidota bacterium]